MKKVGYVFLFTGILAFTCNKSETDFDGITGVWDLVEISGQIPLKKVPAGTEHLILTPTNFEIHDKDQPVQKGTYSVSEDPTVEQEVCLVISNGDYAQSVILDGAENKKKIFFQLNGVSLKTLSGCFAYDGGTYKKYIRIGDANENAGQ